MPTYAFDSEESIRKVVQATQIVLREHRNVVRPPSGSSSVDLQTFYNEHDTAVPSYAAMKITGMRPDGRPFTVTQSTEYGAQYMHLINGPRAVGPQESGVAVERWPAWALCDTNDGTPAVGEFWGPVPDSWKLRKYVGGFQVVGIPGSENTDRNGLALVTPAPMLMFVGKTDGEFTAGSTGTVIVWHGELGEEEETEYSFENVYDRFADLDDGAWVEVYYRNGNWEIIQGVCPA